MAKQRDNERLIRRIKYLTLIGTLMRDRSKSSIHRGACRQLHGHSMKNKQFPRTNNSICHLYAKRLNLFNLFDRSTDRRGEIWRKSRAILTGEISSFPSPFFPLSRRGNFCLLHDNTSVKDSLPGRRVGVLIAKRGKHSSGQTRNEIRGEFVGQRLVSRTTVPSYFFPHSREKFSAKLSTFQSPRCNFPAW